MSSKAASGLGAMRTALATTLLVFLSGVARAADPGIEFFEAKVRPVLVDNCYACHSTAAKKQKATGT